jgi:hypothetical protein
LPLSRLPCRYRARAYSPRRPRGLEIVGAFGVVASTHGPASVAGLAMREHGDIASMPPESMGDAIGR